MSGHKKNAASFWHRRAHEEKPIPAKDLPLLLWKPGALFFRVSEEGGLLSPSFHSLPVPEQEILSVAPRGPFGVLTRFRRTTAAFTAHPGHFRTS